MNGSEINPETILANIALARQHGLLVQVNMVVIRGVNEEQIIPMARYFKEHNITLRFIEFMDVGNQNRWTASNVVTKQEIIKKLSAYFQLEAIE
ncbi:Cyclic pyranopterin monophosphate synthase [compost metagenome]